MQCKQSLPTCNLLGQDLPPLYKAANWSTCSKSFATLQVTKLVLEENRNLLRTIQIIDRLNCLLKVPLSLHWLHGEPQESIFLSTLVKCLKLCRIIWASCVKIFLYTGLIHVYRFAFYTVSYICKHLIRFRCALCIPGPITCIFIPLQVECKKRV